MKLVIKGRLPGMNEITKENRNNRYGGAKQKRAYDDLIVWSCKACKLEPIYEKVDVTFTWFCKNRRRDKDNIMSAQKFIFDGLQKAKIIKNDGWNEIGNIYHKFKIDKNNERVEVEFIESEKNMHNM